MILSVEESDIISLGDKVKFPTCTIVHIGNQKSATDYMYENIKNKSIVGMTITGGDQISLSAGYCSVLTAGNYSILTFLSKKSPSLRWGMNCSCNFSYF